MKQFIIIILIVVAVIGLGTILFIQDGKRPPTKEEDIVARNGVHWHPQVSVYIRGQKQEVPPNLGLVLGMAAIHTHDSSGTIHVEPSGRVTKNDIRLGRLFEVWGKRFSSTCVFEECANEPGHVKMTVNGKDSIEFENYLMQDKDQIEIRYR